LGTIQRFRIASIDENPPGTRIFRLEPEEGQVPEFLPGQFAFIHILDKSGKSADKRPYSIASAPGGRHMEFCIKMVKGRMTSKLELLKAGDALGVEGPLGRFTYTGQPAAAFIAGGSGIAPFMSMLRHIAAKKLKGKFVLFYSSRTKDGISYEKELKSLQQANPDIRVVITLTREVPDGWAGECGRLNDGMIIKHTDDAKDFSWWVCGPMELINSMKACLAGMGVDPKKLELEGWG